MDIAEPGVPLEAEILCGAFAASSSAAQVPLIFGATILSAILTVKIFIPLHDAIESVEKPKNGN